MCEVMALCWPFWLAAAGLIAAGIAGWCRW